MNNKTRFTFVAMIFVAMTMAFTACGGDTFKDPRDGQKYKTVKIGDKVWMAETIKYNGHSSYSWDSALVACPDGWHLPSKSELESVVADTNIRGTIWSSTEKEDFSSGAYIKRGESLSLVGKGDKNFVKCVQGEGEKQTYFKEFNGYKAVRIGNQIWMANNLDIKTPNSICYLDDEKECSKGRFYPYREAKNVCPEGWHLPSKSEAAKFINKLKKEGVGIKTTQGYYVSKNESFEDTWGEVMLWTSTYGYLICNRRGLEVWDGKAFLSDNWKIAVRCIADSVIKGE